MYEEKIFPAAGDMDGSWKQLWGMHNAIYCHVQSKTDFARTKKWFTPGDFSTQIFIDNRGTWYSSYYDMQKETANISIW